MMKIFAIIGLILMFWCHQSQHHIFLLINTTPLGLASEEYIPVGAETNSKSTVEVKDGNEAVVGGSQTIKSDSVNVNVESTSSQFVETVQNVEGSGVPAPTSKEEPLPPVEIPGESHKSQEPDKSQSEVHDAEKSSDKSADKIVEPTASKDVHTESRPESTAKVSEDLSEVVNTVDPTSNSSAPVEDSSDNNQTNEQGVPVPEQSTSGSPVVPNLVSLPPKEEEPIPSFMEWTHQKLHETNSAPGANGNGHTNGHTNGHKNSNTAGSQQNKSTQATQGGDDKSRKGNNAKNFGSPDCGAKVIQSNAESQNPSGVLSGSTDEYMLNKCGTSTWFIIELCEPLKIEKVSLGNLELFSSSPKDIEIGISDRYPTREWTKLGPFTLPDFRAIHPIELPATNASTFGKFLKVNVLSHWGSEHYCPLSLIKVNGISEYEVLESENTHQDEIEGADKEESALYEEPVIVQQSTEGAATATDKSVFGSAKDAVINIVKKAAQVLAKSDNTKDASQLGVSPQSSCRSLLQCLPSYEAQFREHVLSLLSCNFSDLLPFLSKNSPWCGWDYCHSLFNRHSIGLPWQPEGFYASIFGGPSVLHALCNYHKPLSKETCDAFFLHTATASPNDGVPAEGYINESLKSPPLTVGSGTSSETPKDTDNFIIVKEPVAEVVKPEITDAPSPVEVNNGGQNGEAVKVPQQAKESSPVIEPISNGNNGEVHQNTAPPTLPPVTTNPPGNGNAEDTNGNIAPSSQQQPHVPGQQQQQQKESVFVRLSNRIKTLERNQSLTASYLEELSRRFKKQNEENYHINEGTRNFINESRIKFKTLEDLYKFELRSLRRNTDEIRERLFNVQLQRSVLILLCLMQFTGLVCAYIWVRNRFNQFENRLQTPPQQQHIQTILPSPSRPYILSHRAQSSSCPDSPQHVILGRKRINSDASIGSSLSSFDKSKKIKKKKKKLADLKPLTLKAAGPASAPLEYHNKPEGVFKFDSPKSSSSAYNLSSVLSSSNFKENIKPEPKSDSEIHMERKPLLFGGDAASMRSSAGSPSRPASLSTKVEPPFSMISSTGAIFYPDHGVSTSSRFAILASPGPAPPGKPSNLKRSGSLTSLDDRSSISSLGEKTGIQCIVNGHGNNGDSHSQGSNGSGKKRKNKGFKAFMPKIFDR